jgi:hypothetical protein
MIYAACLPYGSINHIISLARRGRSASRELRTPTILLLNRQITAEAISAWHKEKPVTITQPFPLILIMGRPTRANPAGITSRTTIQALTHMQIIVDLTGSEYTWNPTLGFFEDAWEEQTKLEVLKFRVIESPEPSDSGRLVKWMWERLSMSLPRNGETTRTDFSPFDSEYTFVRAKEQIAGNICGV